MPRTRSAQRDFDWLADRLAATIQRASAALHDCRTALQRSDGFLAARIMAADEDIDALQLWVERAAVRVIISRQPVARDLRWVLAAISIAAELERIGDYTKQIATQVKWATQAQQSLLALPALTELGLRAQESYDACLSAFHAEDAGAARRAAQLDDLVDQAYRMAYQAIRSAIMADCSLFDAGQASLVIAHAFERLSDRATNIAERTIFLATTVHEPLNE
jgi:phosphate transport system protein